MKKLIPNISIITIPFTLNKGSQFNTRKPILFLFIFLTLLISFSLIESSDRTVKANLDDLPAWRNNLACEPDNQKFSGVEYCTARKPYSDTQVIVVDLQSPGIKFEYVIPDGYDKDNNFGECQDINRASKQLGGPGCDASENRLFYPVMDINAAKGKFPDAIAVINSDYGAGTQDEPDSREHGPEGLTIIQGNRIDGPLLGDEDNNAALRPWLAISNTTPLKANIAIMAKDSGEFPDWIYTAVGGGPWLIHNSEVLGGVSTDCRVNYSGSCYPNATQTAVGISADGRWIFFVIMKGVSEDLHELVNFFAQAVEAEEAMKLDGGGSSQLWYAGLPQNQQNIISSSRQLSQYLAIIAPAGTGIDLTIPQNPTYTEIEPREPGDLPTNNISAPEPDNNWLSKIGEFFKNLSQERIDGFGLGSSAHLRSGWPLVKKDYDEMANLGVHWAREEIPWVEVEPSPGNFQWVYNPGRNFPELFNYADEKGIKILAVLDYGPNGLGVPISEEILRRWETYVQAVVDEFGETIDYWEIENEMNSSFFWGKVVYSGDNDFLDTLADPDPVLYAKMLSAAYEIIKRKDPNDVVVLGGLIVVTDGTCLTNPFRYLGRLYEEGVWDKFDVSGFHPYWANSPEYPIIRGKQHDPYTGACLETDRVSNMIEEIQALNTLADQFGSKPIWITELGWNQKWLINLAGYRGISPDDLEADYVVRTYIPLLSGPGVENVFWYTQVRDAQSEDFELSPPGKRALKNLSKLLTGAEIIGQIQGQEYDGSTGDDVFEYRFSKDDKLIIYAWKAAGGEVPREVIISDLSNNEALKYWADTEDLSPENGEKIPIEDKQIKVALTEKPIILIIQKTDFLDQWWIDLQNNFDDWMEELNISIQARIEKWINQLASSLLKELAKQLELMQINCCGTVVIPVIVGFVAITKNRKILK